MDIWQSMLSICQNKLVEKYDLETKLLTKLRNKSMNND